MKRLVSLYVIVIMAIAFVQPVHAGDAKEYVDKARTLADAGNYQEALAVLEKAAQEYPEDSDIHAYLGLYTGMSAGQTSDYMEAGRLAMLSFELLDKAISLDEGNVTAYLLRGIMGIKVPSFMGKLGPGIADLNHVIEMREQHPDKVSDEVLVTAYSVLAEGHLKSEDPDNARTALEMVVELAPGTPAAESAEKQLAQIEGKKTVRPDIYAVKEGDAAGIAALKEKIKADPGSTALVLKLGTVYYDAGEYEEAVGVLKEYVSIDQSSAAAYKMLGISIAQLASVGYDERIAEDTDLRSGQAFEAIAFLDQAVKLTPEDIELRLTRGIFGVMFPFFVGKHEQGVEDLEYVIGHTESDDVRSEALYYLGVARQREAMRYWIEVASKYPESNAAKMVYGEMRPEVKAFDPEQHQKPIMAIDFVLGFQDELPPQTAIWIEDESGDHVRTLYVSGFSGYAKEKQVNLPVWSAISKYEGCEAVTSASIDVGRHIYTWDLKDLEGKKVKKGTYKVRVEVSYWPSMKYQNVEAVVELGKKSVTALVEEGDFIPRLEVSYFPR